MVDRLPHLEIARSAPSRPRYRPSAGFSLSPVSTDDYRAHGERLQPNLQVHSTPPEDQQPGFDPRLLLRIRVEGSEAKNLPSFPGFTLVAEEDGEHTILFADSESMSEFRRRLQSLQVSGKATRKGLLYAVKAFHHITAADRTGPRLASEGFVQTGQGIVDVELWSLDLSRDRALMAEHFREQCRQLNTEILDYVNNSVLVIYRVRTSPDGLTTMLNMRDVRSIDLPPRYQFDLGAFDLSVADLPTIIPPPDNAPTIAVLDSGVVTNHPLLSSAIGDAQAFNGGSANDSTGHGTAVAGLALYGDLHNAIKQATLQSQFRLLSGKIANTGDDFKLTENRITEAVEYFVQRYGCRIFNLSIGSFDKPYRGGHVDSLAATLDRLAREHQVLFVISSGNTPSNFQPDDPLQAYPGYLLEQECRMVDPAPAINALTVGGLARSELPRMAARVPNDPAIRPIAATDQPSPFTLAGPGPNKAIKPDLVEYAGNRYVDTRQGTAQMMGGDLGELALSSQFASGNLFRQVNGTSFATPLVAHAAAQILAQYPDASPALIRALLAAHAQVPAASKQLNLTPEALRTLVGYGKPDVERSLYSSNRCVTLRVEAEIAPDQTHYYSIPFPEDLYANTTQRPRRFTVALAYTPRVRRTRREYRESILGFDMVNAERLEHVTAFYQQRNKDDMRPEQPNKDNEFQPKKNARQGSTLQCATRIRQRLNQSNAEKPYFLMVTHTKPQWVGSPEPEPYALVVVIEDLSTVEVDLYQQIELELTARVQQRARTRA